MLHYFARKFFAPVLISPALSHGNVLNIYLINDSLPAIPPLPGGNNVSNWIHRRGYEANVGYKAMANEHHALQYSRFLKLHRLYLVVYNVKTFFVKNVKR